MTEDPPTEPGSGRLASARRRRHVIAAGHAGNVERARQGLADPDPLVQAAGLNALARAGALTVRDIAAALAGGSVEVRRRAADAALSVGGKGSRSELYAVMVAALEDPDPLVAVNAAWFLAERRARVAVPSLSSMARLHDDVRCREAAVASLGAIGDPAGLDAVVAAALDDKPTVRRRATVALAGFDHPDVEPALRRAADDRDWQVRQAAEELLTRPS